MFTVKLRICSSEDFQSRVTVHQRRRPSRRFIVIISSATLHAEIQNPSGANTGNGFHIQNTPIHSQGLLLRIRTKLGEGAMKRVVTDSIQNLGDNKSSMS